MRRVHIQFSIIVIILALFVITNPVEAHEFEQHDSESSIAWIVASLMIVGSTITIGTWTKAIYSGFVQRDYNEMLRATTVLLSFLFWYLLIGIQNYILSIGNNMVIYNIAVYSGYFVLPFALLSLWRIIWPYSYNHLSHILKLKSYRTLFFFSLIGYSLFYLFASGWVSPPDPEDPPLPSTGFFGFYENWGPLTIWPNIEFWLPSINIFGAISIGALLMLLSLSGFMAISIVLFVYSLKKKQQKQFHMGAIGNITSSSLALTATSFCCCCLPVLYPVLTLLVGSVAAETLSLLLISTSSPLFNIIQTAVLSLMAFSVISLSKKIDQLESGECEI